MGIVNEAAEMVGEARRVEHSKKMIEHFEKMAANYKKYLDKVKDVQKLRLQKEIAKAEEELVLQRGVNLRAKESIKHHIAKIEKEL